MSQMTIINQPNLRIERNTGSEGPAYDPYHYEEWEFERNGNTIELHNGGLVQWMEINGKRYDDVRDEAMEDLFKEYTGFTFHMWMLFLRKLEAAKWRKHWGHDVVEVSGYPGEHFTICNTCDGKMLSSFFDISEVE